MATDLEQRDKQQERELWLLLAGALLASKGNPDVAKEVFASVDVNDAGADELVGLLGGIKHGSGKKVQQWLTDSWGTNGPEGSTAVQRITAALRKRVAKKACKLAAGQINMATADPVMFVEYLERHAAIVKSKL